MHINLVCQADQSAKWWSQLLFTVQKLHKRVNYAPLGHGRVPKFCVWNILAKRIILPSDGARIYAPVRWWSLMDLSFKPLFGLGGIINPSLYNSSSNSLKRKAGSITWKNGCFGQTIWYTKFQNPIWNGGSRRINPSLYNSLKRKAGCITWQNGRISKMIWYANFQNSI